MSEPAANSVLQSEPKATGGILDSEPAAVGGILSSEPANTASPTPAASSSASAPANTEPAATTGSGTPAAESAGGSAAGAGKETRVTALPAVERADKLHGLLQRIRAEASADLAGFYSVPALAIEGWLSTAIAAAEQLAAELRGDVVPPGGEHGGPAD